MSGQSVVDGIDELGAPGATAMAAKCGQNDFDEIDRPRQRVQSLRNCTTDRRTSTQSTTLSVWVGQRNPTRGSEAD